MCPARCLCIQSRSRSPFNNGRREPLRRMATGDERSSRGMPSLRLLLLLLLQIGVRERSGAGQTPGFGAAAAAAAARC
ncbi:Hypothetical predicted protein [Podarcis lilfordi]|uniref:Uncharacterized protein n=1 Tax=Podarcis lilfordi TaxID=74358 RepID=A0AA35P4L9_9SAUR|nr:Hypothetical predicted protein [Podarcis lilfordi]